MGNVRKKRPYRKNTPVGRLRRNAEKVAQHAGLLRARAASWGVGDARVAAVVDHSASIVGEARKVDKLLASLEESGFVPPEKPRSVTWQPGDRVAVAGKFREKYETVYRANLETDPGFLDDLVVDTVLPSGEVSVRKPRGRVPFTVPKTHLVGSRAAGEAGGTP